MVSVCVQINNPDKRCVILKSFAKEHFPSTPLIDYASEVEKITTSKVQYCCLTISTVLFYVLYNRETDDATTGAVKQALWSCFTYCD